MRAILAGIAGTFVAVIGIIIFFLLGQTDQQALDAAALRQMSWPRGQLRPHGPTR
ncbi:MAG: hypothetical protein HC844_11120 [Tabrizicola sp.]|nr:hypothetical protein [Tabrizicola sp.]